MNTNDEPQTDSEIVLYGSDEQAKRAAGDRLIAKYKSEKKYGPLALMAKWDPALMETRKKAGLAALDGYVEAGNYPQVLELAGIDDVDALPDKVKAEATKRLGEAVRIAIAKYAKEQNKEELFEIESNPCLPQAERELAHKELERLGGYEYMRDSFPKKALILLAAISNQDAPASALTKNGGRNGFKFAGSEQPKPTGRKLLH